MKTESYKRLIELRDMHGLSDIEFAEKIGVPKSSMSMYLSGKRSMKQNRIAAVAMAFNVNPAWVMGYDVPMEPSKDYQGILETNHAESYNVINVELTEEEFDIVTKYRSLDDSGKKYINYTLTHESERICQIERLREMNAFYGIRKLPFIGMNAAAGTFTDFMDAADDTVECQDSDICRKADFAIGVTGDSMEPTYSSGDIVLVRYSSEIPIGKIGLFRRGSEIFIKERGKDGLISHNPERPFKMDVNNIECIGEVLGKAVIAGKEDG